MTTANDILRTRFGYDAFRPGQADLVDAILAGRDALGVMPTGAGKSICYQVPALALPGVAIVISPLVSLMNDQVSALREAGIPAAYLNSQLTPSAQAATLNDASAGAFKLLYVAPERLDDPRFTAFAREANISLIAIDEAHCVSQWGQDFRPSYLRIADFIASLASTSPTEPANPFELASPSTSAAERPRPPAAAFTATATPRVADDIARLLGLVNPVRVTTGFDRPNLRFEVEQLPDKRKLARTRAFIAERPAESGIIYCSTRKQVESLASALISQNIPATRYHAGLSAAERTANQLAFVHDDAPVMVATNAFGMGIDKSNVRYVVHFNMPASLEAYYQEAGRAGRDGEPATCLLLWNDGDIATSRYFIESELENDALTPEEVEIVRASQRRRLAVMSNYCMTTDCLRATILRYFGDLERERTAAPMREPGVSDVSPQNRSTFPEEATLQQGNASPDPQASASAPSDSCGNCSNCDGITDAIDVTKTARSIMRCVHEVRGRYGKGVVADILTGSKNAKIRDWHLDRLRTYDIVEDSTATVKEIIELLTAGAYLEISEGRYPIVGLGPRAREAATDEFRLYMKRMKKVVATPVGAGGRSASGTAAKSGTGSTAAQLQTPEQRDLFERLRQLRKRLADEEGVPPYIVFSDAALRDMCVQLPATDEEFLQVNGVGPVKQKRYATPFLAEINRG